MKISHGSDGTEIELTIDELHDLLNKQMVVGGDVRLVLGEATGDMLFTSIRDGKVTKFKGLNYEEVEARIVSLDARIASKNAKHFANPTRDQILLADDRLIDTQQLARCSFREVHSKPGEPRRFIRE